MKKLSFQKVHNEKVFFQKAECLVKVVKKCFFEKTECLASTYKSGGLSYTFPKRTRYIYIREFFVLIISLHASYGHNIFTKILQ